MKLFAVITCIASFHLLARGQTLQDRDEDFLGSLEQAAELGANEKEHNDKEGKDSGAMEDTGRDLGYVRFVHHRYVNAALIALPFVKTEFSLTFHPLCSSLRPVLLGGMQKAFAVVLFIFVCRKGKR